MRVVRVYHGGRDSAHRARERALQREGVAVTLIVPSTWPDGGAETTLTAEEFDVIELPVARPGDVNRHRYADARELAAAIERARPDLLDIHEEPFSAVSHQLLSVVPRGLPVVMYTAQNVDKRYPPPFTRWEQASYQRVDAMYPCSRQAASFARGRGFAKSINVLPLGYDSDVFGQGQQAHDDGIFRISLVGRLIPEKGIRDAISTLASVMTVRAASLTLAGTGPESARVAGYCAEAGVSPENVVQEAWVDQERVADIYRNSHVVLCPSRATRTWVEQFGRMIPEAQACGAVVVGYASGSVPEVLGGAGWLSPEGDIVGLARATRDIANSADVWQRLRAAGLAAAADKTWAQVGASHAAMYASVLGGHSTAAARAGRQHARNEFGPTASVASHVSRPFALPLLRAIPLGRMRAPEGDRRRLRSRPDQNGPRAGGE